MEYRFNEDQLSIRETLREFTKKEVAPLDADMDKNGFNNELYIKMRDMGLLGIHYPEEYGGAGLDPVTGAMTIHEIARGSASMALFLDAHWLAADAVLNFGTEEQKKKYLPIKKLKVKRRRVRSRNRNKLMRVSNGYSLRIQMKARSYWYPHRQRRKCRSSSVLVPGH